MKEIRITKPIVLIGMMGAGKSSLGTRLAERLKLAFVDADTEIETAAGMSVAEIFEAHGEAAPDVVQLYMVPVSSSPSKGR